MKQDKTKYMPCVSHLKLNLRFSKHNFYGCHFYLFSCVLHFFVTFMILEPLRERISAIVKVIF